MIIVNYEIFVSIDFIVDKSRFKKILISHCVLLIGHLVKKTYSWKESNHRVALLKINLLI